MKTLYFTLVILIIAGCVFWLVYFIEHLMGKDESLEKMIASIIIVDILCFLLHICTRFIR